MDPMFLDLVECTFHGRWCLNVIWAITGLTSGVTVFMVVPPRLHAQAPNENLFGSCIYKLQGPDIMGYCSVIRASVL